MNIYTLRPAPDSLDDPSWRASMHREPCVVYADTEAEAREAAHAAFTIAVERTDRRRVLTGTPWLQERLVTCKQAADHMPGKRVRGMVLRPDGSVLFDPNKD